jgi:CheY-like chemotaxis protein
MTTETESLIKALLIEDDPLARLVARKSLEACGCFVTEADCVATGRSVWEANTFDVVVCDHRLPDGTGLELIEAMRGQERTECVLYLTAESEDIHEDVQKKLSLAAVLMKPVDLEQLRELLQGLGSEPADNVETVADASGLRREGRFAVWTVPAEADGAWCTDRQREEERWVALDVAGREDVSSDLMAGMQVWSDACRRSGGRFCLVNVGLLLQQALESSGADLDVLEDEADLDSEGRRLASGHERQALLASVVLPDEEVGHGE